MLARLKIGTALSLGFAIALVLAIAIALSSWLGLRSVERGVNELSELALPNTRALAKVDEARTATQRHFNAMMLRRLSSEMRQASFASIEESMKRLSEGRKEWEAIASLPETEAAWKGMAAAADSWLEPIHAGVAVLKERERLLATGVAADSPKIQQIDEQAWSHYLEARKRGRPVDAELAKVRTAMEKEARGQADAAHAAARQAQVTLVVVLLLAAAILIPFAFALTRGIGRVVRGLTTEAGKLSSAVQAGKLQVRGDPRAVHFEFRGVVEGMNDTMEAFAKPIQVTAQYVDRISKGDLPPKITEPYEGDFNLIKQNLNTCIDAVGALVEDSLALSQAAVEGKLSTRADAARHKGDFQKIVEGVNQTLDAVLGPIQEAAQVLEKLSRRDLRARVAGSYQGDHARIKEALNSTAEALHEAISQVAQAVGQVSAAAGQIASASEAVATGASEQSSSLEETSSSLESMASMTKQSADNAQQANALAQEANKAATEGSAAVEQMTGAMGKIKASAEGTSQIIKDINEIAFQTNLLALNAAVEAARAGEAGRGFAVVAEEVRSLALRSKEAANKTEQLIRESVKQAGEGEVTAKHVTDQLGAIAASVSKVSGIVAEIAASAKEQATGIDQVSQAVEQIGQVTQHNAANSEESSSAAAELSGQSEELAAMVGTFQVQVSATARHAPAAAPKLATKPSKVRSPKARQGAKSSQASAIALRPEEILPLDGEPAFKEF